MSPKIARFEGVTDAYSKERFEVNFRVTSNCNLCCHYCTQHRKSGYSTLSNLLSVVKFVEQIPHTNILIYLHGGEPTLHPAFLQFVQQLLLAEKKIDVSIQTNLTCSLEQLQILLKLHIPKDSCLSITPSFHVGYTEYNSFVQKVRLIHKAGCLTVCKVMLDAECIKESLNAYTTLRSEDFNVRPIFVVDYTGSHSEIFFQLYPELRDCLEEEDEEFYIEYIDGTSKRVTYDDIITNKITNFRGMLCRAGANHILIDHNGSLYFCHAHWRSSSSGWGNLYTGSNDICSITQNLRPTMCLWKNCSCGLALPKEIRNA